MWFSILFGLFLIAFSATMLQRDRAAWRHASADEMPERDFLDRRYRRRRRANVMISLVGLAVILGVWVPDTLVAVVYWLGVALLVCWMALLAVADLIATRRYYGRLHQDQKNERALLEAELDQIRRRDGNGRPNHKPLEEL